MGTKHGSGLCELEMGPEWANTTYNQTRSAIDVRESATMLHVLREKVEPAR